MGGGDILNGRRFCAQPRKADAMLPKIQGGNGSLCEFTSIWSNGPAKWRLNMTENDHGNQRKEKKPENVEGKTFFHKSQPSK